MSKHLHRDLESLEQDLLAQSAVVEQMIYRAARSLSEQNSDLLAELMADEQRVNRREVEIEEECLKLLALHQPVAVDLRRVTTVLKVNGDLERVADLAVGIGERTTHLAEHPEATIPEGIYEMVELAVAMVRSSIDAFVRLDLDAARAVRRTDRSVDELHRSVIAELGEAVDDRGMCFAPALDLYTVSRNVERIADHATNIAEDVIYLVDGEIARHRPPSWTAGVKAEPWQRPGF
ncbi:MAG: phosphate signaling complex protein PhoU [Planctomycetota bacterium]